MLAETVDDLSINALRKAEELSNDDPQYVKQLVALFEKAGRHQEAEAERRKLPQEEIKKLSVSDQFAECGVDQRRLVTDEP